MFRAGLLVCHPDLQVIGSLQFTLPHSIKTNLSRDFELLV